MNPLHLSAYFIILKFILAYRPASVSAHLPENRLAPLSEGKFEGGEINELKFVAIPEVVPASLPGNQSEYLSEALDQVGSKSTTPADSQGVVLSRFHVLNRTEI